MADSQSQKDMNKEPLSTYECHIGSWMKHPDGTEDGFYTYRQFARQNGGISERNAIYM